MVNKKVVILCSIIALIIVGAIVGIKIKNFKDTQNAMMSKVNQSEISSNKVNSENLISNENNVTSEENKNESTDNQSSQEQIKGEEEKTSEKTENNTENTTSDNNNSEEQNGDEAAINLVKKEWGADDKTVYYTIDTKSSDTTYTISVRSKSTTEQLAEYDVDLKDKTVVIK